MSFSYNTSMSAASDIVRYLVGDTVEATAVFSDEEINAVLQLSTVKIAAARPYSVAAEMLRAIQARMMTRNGGLVEKQVDGLRHRWGTGEASFSAAIEARIRELQIKAASFGRQRVFRVYGGSEFR